MALGAIEFDRASTDVTDVISVIEDETTGPLTTPPDRLVCVVGEDLGKTFVIGNEPTVLGRGSELRATDVSRSHARIWRDGSAVYLEDLDSANGTFVNGRAVRGAAVQLSVGDRVQLASSIFVFTRHDALEERLQQLQKLDAMGALVKGLAHDFNNMLMVMQSGLEIIALRWPTERDEDVQQTFDEMAKATDQAAGLVRRLLRIGRAKPPTAELVELSALVDEAIAMARHLKLERVTVTSRMEQGAVVNGARDELLQVFINLLVNARDAMPDGGELSITGRLTELDRATALGLHLPTAGWYVDIAVSDTGVGMDAATLARIFEPFFTTKPVGKGSGLGLAMVYSSIRNHSGAIYAESTRGYGTTFRVLLPVAG